MTLSAGTVLENRYRIDALLGQGGMGAVYRAWHLGLHQNVAVKENSLASPASGEQFAREARMMARLRHANLPRVIDHFVLRDGAQYLVMEYIEGQDLGQVLQRSGPLDEAHALAWIDQVCEALAYLHSQDPPIIHRDIKPGNIKITPQGQVFLVDFGIAKLGEALDRTRTGALGVTTGYSPPEQHGSGGTDARSDIYALGATLYTLLTGRVPPDSVQRSIRAATLTPTRQIRPDLSPSLADAISAALNTAPTDRPQTIAAFRALLRPGRTPAPPSPKPTGKAPSSRRSVPVWGWVAGGIVVLLICGLSAGALGAALPSLLGRATITPVPAETPDTPVAALTQATDTPTKPPTEEVGPAADAYECTDDWGCAVFEEGDHIKVGYAGPLTGDYSDLGTDMSRGAEMAIKAHPTIKGFKVELRVEDTQGTEGMSAAAATEFSLDPQVVAVDGHAFSNSTEAGLPIYEDAGIVMMSPAATRSDLTQTGSEVFNRVIINEELELELAAKYIYEQLRVTRITVMYDDIEYYRGVAEAMTNIFEALGGTVADRQAVPFVEDDYSVQLQAVAALEPELIYFGGIGLDGARLVAQMAAAGLEDTPFFGSYAVQFDKSSLDTAGDAADGIFSLHIPTPETEAYREYREAYRVEYGEEEGGLSGYSAHSYDAMAVLLAAIDEVAVEHGSSLIIPRRALAREVRGTRGFAGLTGTITCDDTGECADVTMRVVVVEGGEWVEAPGQ